ncbi:type I restriction endonuclease subunit S [Propionibacterium freudenreichii]|nr:type I restriction endonuclease subunit S [Propionibacterium freudenreichii]
MVKFRSGQDYKRVSDESGDVPVYGSGGIFATANDYLYHGESVLFGRKGTVDRPLHVNGRFWTIDTMFYTELSEGICGRWLYYWATTIPFSLYSTDTALPSMTSSTLGRLKLPLIDPTEQRRIADHLDEVTGKIDAMLAKVAELKSLLIERRAALITDVVTGRKAVA